MIIDLCIAVIAFQIIGCSTSQNSKNIVPFPGNIILIDSSDKHHVIIGKGEHIRSKGILSKGILEKTFEVDFEIEKIKNSDNYFWNVKIATAQENCTEKINIIRLGPSDKFIIENNDKIKKYMESITRKRNKIKLNVKYFQYIWQRKEVGIIFTGFYENKELFNLRFNYYNGKNVPF